MQHRWTGDTMGGLATAYEALDRRDDALPLRRELLDRVPIPPAAPE
jgi:hypothetical protein